MLSKRSVLQEFAFLATAAAFLFIALFFWRINSLHDVQVQQHLERQSAALEKELATTLHHTDTMLHYMASQIGQRNDENAHDYYMQLFNAFAADKTVEKSLAWSAVAWVRSDRKLTVDSAMGVVKKPIDMSDRDYIALSERRPGVLQIGKPVTGVVSKRQVIPAALGVVNVSGEYLGSLIIGFDVQNMASAMNALVDPTEEEFTVLDGDQNPLIRSPASDKPLVMRKPYILHKLDGLPFSVHVTISETFRGPSYASIIKEHLLEFVLGATLLAGMLVYLHRRIVRPIGKLARAAESIAGGNMDIAIPRNGAREIEALADQLEDVKSAVTRVVAERAMAQEEKSLLEKIMIAKARQARNLVHDLRSHASVVITFADILAGNHHGKDIDPQYAEYAQDIQRSGSQILDMVNEILDLEKARHGKLDLEPSRIHVPELVEISVRCFERKAKLRGVSIVLDIPASLPDLYADFRRLRRMVQNLVSNSMKFTRSGGTVRISYLLDAKNRPVIRVTDTGKGMTPQEITVALSEFGQVQQEGLHDHDSTGIGLPFVKQLMEEHGGHLEIESEKGKGTTVSMVFDAQAVRYSKPKLTLVKAPG